MGIVISSINELLAAVVLVDPLLTKNLITVAALVDSALTRMLWTNPPLVASAVKTVNTVPVPSPAVLAVVPVGIVVH
jgi:hypothetical protein